VGKIAIDSPTSADDHLGGMTPDSGDFVETVYRGQIRRFARVVGVGSGRWRLGGWYVGDQCLDHRPAGDPHHVGGHRGQFEQGIL